jgi:hypothetical protein
LRILWSAFLPSVAVVSERGSLRTQRVEIRVTSDEAEELAQRAHAAGYGSISEYVRARTLETEDAPRARPFMPVHHAALVRALSSVGITLRHTYDACAQEAVLREDLLRALDTVREAIESLA